MCLVRDFNLLKHVSRVNSIMKNRIFPFLFLLLIAACHSSSQKDTSLYKDLSKVKVGMSYVDVMQLAGAPDTIIHLGAYEDTFRNQTKTDEWHYGNNQIVVIVNDTVNAIDLNANETQQRIQYIIDSARAVEGNSKPFIQPSQQ
jgi:hypothetical protein